MASDDMSSRSNTISIRTRATSRGLGGFVFCASNSGYEVSLERGKIYRTLRDDDAAVHAQVRVIDESGEDYLFPQALFLPVNVPRAIRNVLMRAG